MSSNGAFMLLPTCIFSIIQKASEVKCFLNVLRYSNVMLYLTWQWQMDRNEKTNWSSGKGKHTEMCLLPS